MSLSQSFINHAGSWPLVVLLLLAAVSSFAHDPYEITATAKLETNRLDLDLAMEFRTGLRLAGVEPRPPEGVSAADWFAQNQAALEACAKSFCEIQAGENALPVRSATVSLAVEDHIEFHIEYPPATEQPLRFDAAGLKALAGLGQYGVALTVLDMVNLKVLGQPVIYADAPTLVAELPPRSVTGIVSQATAKTTYQPAVIAHKPSAPVSLPVKQKTVGGVGILALVSGVTALLLLVLIMQRNRGKS